MGKFGKHVTLAAWAIWLTASVAAAAQAAEHRAAAVVPGLSEIDDPPEPLVPRQPRTEEDADTIESLALFAAGRAAEDREDRLLALRMYERAYRRNPDAIAPLQQIVPLASQMNREDTAMRFAVKLAERDTSERRMAGNLGAILADMGTEDEAAVRLLEKAVADAAASDEPGEQYQHLFRLGRVCARLGDYAKAARALASVEEALAAPESHKLTEKTTAALREQMNGTDEFLGETYLSAGDVDRARKAFERAYPAEDIANRSFRAAQVAIKAGDDAAALTELDRYIAHGEVARGDAPYRLLAEIYTRQNRAAEIMPKLTGLWEANREDYVGIVLAEQLLTAQEWEKAADIFDRLRAGNYELPSEQGLATVYQKTKKAKELLDLLGARAIREPGIEALDKQVEEIATDGEALDLLIAEARSRKESKDSALTFPAAFATGLVAAEGKRSEVAAEFYEAAVALNAEAKAQVYLAWGVGALLADDFANAAKIFQRGIDEKALQEGNPLFHYHLSGALEMLGQTDKAVAAAQEAGKLWKRVPNFAVREPWILYHAKRYDDAKSAYVKLVDELEGLEMSELEEDYNRMVAREIFADARQAARDSRLALSNISVAQKDMPGAEEWLEQVLDEFPDDVGALNDLAYLWSDQGKRLNRSLEMLQHAVSKAPENLAYRDSLGWVNHKLGRNAEALPEIERAATEKDADGVIFDHLGDVQHALGNADAAKDAWTKAISAFERDKKADEAEAVRKKLAGP